MKTALTANYYSFKIFLRFWLAKITHIIHHNQLLLTKFGRILPCWTDDVKSAAKLQIFEQLTEKTWGRVWVIFEVSNGEDNTFNTSICIILHILRKPNIQYMLIIVRRSINLLAKWERSDNLHLYFRLHLFIILISPA